MNNEQEWEARERLGAEPFNHGEEGTHSICNEIIEQYGSGSPCCQCTNHQCRPMNNWKEQLEDYVRRGNSNDAIDFVQVEIIEKLIEDIPDIYNKYKNSGVGLTKPDYIKQQLRRTWL